LNSSAGHLFLRRATQAKQCSEAKVCLGALQSRPSFPRPQFTNNNKKDATLISRASNPKKYKKYFNVFI